MKLSAAIRIGSMTTKQISNRFTDGGNGRCALGAALDATGTVVHGGAKSWNSIRELFPSYPSQLLHEVWMRNDGISRAQQTREQIADYVEQYENEHDGYLTTGITESEPLELIALEAI